MNSDDRFEDSMVEAMIGELAMTYDNLCWTFGRRGKIGYCPR